ncbi:hypothetical protein [Leptospira stimsonii]|uniref:Uncharacterized protein n=1 Tax=Leptospira stimsonii TaxID=2202203 RepID=A0ABY2N554_9LEPT|nr:hypothetical protein [Leptospira stimsonii]TGK10360.1 hypothetical protein EHO98_22880 [Leptospira stimsonii]TGM17237.1 hypothetical protein EHQ90_07585 [Leptospira stimsonii]
MKTARIRTSIDIIDSETDAILTENYIEPIESLYSFEEGTQESFRAKFSEGYKAIDLSEFENIERIDIECKWNESSLLAGSKIIKGKRAPFTLTINGEPYEIPDNGFFSKEGGLTSLQVRPADPTSIAETEEKEVKFWILICAR